MSHLLDSLNVQNVVFIPYALQSRNDFKQNKIAHKKAEKYVRLIHLTDQNCQNIYSRAVGSNLCRVIDYSDSGFPHSRNKRPTVQWSGKQSTPPRSLLTHSTCAIIFSFHSKLYHISIWNSVVKYPKSQPFAQSIANASIYCFSATV